MKAVSPLTLGASAPWRRRWRSLSGQTSDPNVASPIFATDAVDYSRLMAADEVGNLRMLMAHRVVMLSLIRRHRGRVANMAGDSLLAEFPTALGAVQCTIAVQERLSAIGGTVPDDRRLQFRIGVHVSNIIVHGGDLFGDGVNIAARLQSLAEPGGYHPCRRGLRTSSQIASDSR